MRISSLTNHLPSVRLATPKQIVRNLTLIALPAIALAGLAYAPKAAEAGFGFFAVCMGTCTGATGGFGVLACAAACSASLAPIVP
jgi:hypothetical protein